MQRNYNFKFNFEPYFECYRILDDDSRNALVDAFRKITSNIVSNKEFIIFMNCNNSTQDIRHMFDQVLEEEIMNFIDLSDDIYGLYVFNLLTSYDDWRDIMFSQLMYPLVEEKLITA